MKRTIEHTFQGEIRNPDHVVKLKYVGGKEYDPEILLLVKVSEWNQIQRRGKPMAVPTVVAQIVNPVLGEIREQIVEHVNLWEKGHYSDSWIGTVGGRAMKIPLKDLTPYKLLPKHRA